MIGLASFARKTVAIFGLARSGFSAARALKAGGAEVLAWDDKEAARIAAAAEGLVLEPWERWPWESLAAVVLSPGVPFTHPAPHPVVREAKACGIPVIGDVELFGHAIRPDPHAKGAAPVIAVTGTNGKSTTTALIGHILQSAGFDAQTGGNIGKPVLDLAPPGDRTVYTLEVSSYQIDLAPGLVPDVALLTNISPDHIDRHGTMEAYAAVKASLLARTAVDGHIAIGVDDPFSSAIYTSLAASDGAAAIAVSVGKVLGRGIFVIDGRLYDALDQTPVLIGDLAAIPSLPGAHNWQNAALAYAAVRKLVRDPRLVMQAMMRFPGLAHRIENVGRIGKVRFVNDSKATNAEAAAKALGCFTDVYWIAGGKPKEDGIGSLASYFPRIRKAYLIGEAADAFGRTLSGRVDTVMSGTLENAVRAAYDDARNSGASDPVVLLSPACASFDQFRDFEERGDIFRAKVRGLMAETEMPVAGARSR